MRKKIPVWVSTFFFDVVCVFFLLKKEREPSGLLGWGGICTFPALVFMWGYDSQSQVKKKEIGLVGIISRQNQCKGENYWIGNGVGKLLV